MLIIYLVVSVICFYILSIITEGFFVPSIDKIAKKLRLSSDAAGATLLAMGSSAPEFFTSVIAVFGIAGSGTADVGSGTIVGSAIFNVLVIVGAAAMFKSVTLQWKPVIRDQIFYVLTILMLLWAFWDGKIILIEALSFVLMYSVYVLLAANWRKWFKYKDVEVVDSTEDKKGFNASFTNFVGYLIPSVKKKPKYYMVTFLLSVALIGVISWVLVEQIIGASDILKINPIFLSLTVLAAGTSVPDLIGSIVVAKQGRGDMAVSNAIGSNIFDVLFGLGLPWSLKLLISGGSIAVGKSNLIASVILLFATVIAILFMLIIRNWKIGHKSGLFLIVMYVGYCIYIVLKSS
ncbi:calcium/sodium antiporter [Candidatus Saccharibacteria bacterium]|nr:calcium/sodium antiporter [Candidatus Saccharibacteria bacterium]